MRITVPAGRKMNATRLPTDMTTRTAAEFQHVAIQGLRAAFGWGTPNYDADLLITFLQEEGARIPKGGSWTDYRHVKRTGSRFATDRRTRASIWIAVTTTRILVDSEPAYVSEGLHNV